MVRQSMTPEAKDKPTGLMAQGQTSSNAFPPHGSNTIGSDSDIGALQNLLQNVNVSHKVQSNQGTSENSVLKFPPI